MAQYRRLIQHYSAAGTLLATLCDSHSELNTVVHADFELTRQGGCGGGNLTIAISLNTDSIQVGHYIKMSYSEGNAWYYGRVEEVSIISPSGMTVRLMGLVQLLNDTFVGDFAGFSRPPHKYAKSDAFTDDPDFSDQSIESYNYYYELITAVYNTYINGVTPILLGVIDQPSFIDNLASIVFRGEETVFSFFRALAMGMGDMSWGVNADKELFLTRRTSNVHKTYQEGVDLDSLDISEDMENIYNRLLITGGIVYVGGSSPYNYRYRAHYYDIASVPQWGDRRLELYVPFLRSNRDTYNFAIHFFEKYSQPHLKASFTAVGQETPFNPWEGKIAVNNRDGNLLLSDVFEKLNVTFNAYPVFSIEVGPSVPTFPEPPEEQRFPMPQLPEVQAREPLSYPVSFWSDIESFTSFILVNPEPTSVPAASSGLIIPSGFTSNSAWSTGFDSDNPESSSGTPPASSSGTPTILIVDGWSGSDDDTIGGRTPDTINIPGNDWTVPRGAPTIQSNVWSGSNSSSVIDASTADVDVTTDMVLAGSSLPGASLLIRYFDEDNYWLAQIYTGRDQIELAERDGGVQTIRATSSLGTVNAGDGYKIRTTVGDDDEFNIYIDDVLKIAGYTKSTHNTRTKHGIHTFNTPDSTHELFILKEFP